MKICYFGIYKDDFTRTRVNIAALRSQGHEIIQCVDRTQSLAKYWNLVKKHRALKGEYDLMFVGFPGYVSAVLARLITGKPIMFDAYISYYDGLLDRRSYSALHPKILWARAIDWLSSACSDVVLTINPEYKRFFIDTLRVSASKMEIVHKGADEDVFVPVSRPHEKFIVAWWGSYIPLHGIRYIIEAAGLLRDDAGIEFCLIGNGQVKSDIQREAGNLGLHNIVFIDKLARRELVEEIAGADVALGIFNDTPKALRCVTNKVFEAMCMGKAILTEASPANKEIFTHKRNAYLVRPGDAEAIADAIIELKQDSHLRERLAREARKTFVSRFTAEMIGREFTDIISRHGIH